MLTKGMYAQEEKEELNRMKSSGVASEDSRVVRQSEIS